MAEYRSPPRLSEEEFRLLRDLIKQYCGIYFDDHLKYMLERRLGRRVQKRMLHSFAEYEQFLRFDPERMDELGQVVELLTTNETYFFREKYQLEVFEREVIPEIAERNEARSDRTVRVWSAGCSTGEEAYTLAIILSESRRLSGWQWSVMATDISGRALQQARSGIYGLHSFREEMPFGANKYFADLDGGKKQASEELKKHITFSALNLTDPSRHALFYGLDAIFCRNVLIYFDNATKRKVVDLFLSKLKPGGFLFLGHSESLLNLSTNFALRHFQGDMVYQKPLTSQRGEP